MDKIRNIDELIKLLYNNIGLLSLLYEHRNTFLYKDALDSVDGNSKKLENLFQYGIIEQSDDEHIEISSIHRRYFEEVTQSNVEISGGKMDDFINKAKNNIELIVTSRENNGKSESLYISKLRSTFGDIAYSARLSGDSLSFKVEETYTTEKNFEVKMVLLRQLRESLEDIYNSIYKLYAFLDKEDYILHQKINNPRVNLSIEKMKLSLSEVDRELIFLRAKLLRYIGNVKEQSEKYYKVKKLCALYKNHLHCEQTNIEEVFMTIKPVFLEGRSYVKSLPSIDQLTYGDNAMKGLSKNDIRNILEMLGGTSVASSKLSQGLKNLLESEHFIIPCSHGARITYTIADRDKQLCRNFLASHYNYNCSLEDLLKNYEDADMERGEWVNATGSSKFKTVRTWRGFMVNTYHSIEVALGKEKIVLPSYIGSAFFVNDFTHFSIPNDVIIVGVENPENFFRIREQRYLFDRHFPTKKLLFVCRYPQESKTDMLSWLTGISNRYVHFGDFDFYGIKIFLQEYKKTLLDRASFFIPYDIENRIRKGNSKLYQEQYLCNTSLVCNDDRLTSLLGLFDKYAKVYEQEGYIIK